MKGKWILPVVLILVVITVGWAASGSAGPVPEYETLRLEILKVYAAKDGNSRYRAYVVKWKDQEVVVRDTLVRTDHKEGDIVPVLAMRHKYPNDESNSKPDLLNFEIGR